MVFCRTARASPISPAVIPASPARISNRKTSSLVFWLSAPKALSASFISIIHDISIHQKQASLFRNQAQHLGHGPIWFVTVIFSKSLATGLQSC